MYTRVGLKAWVVTLVLLSFGGTGKATATQVVERDSAGVRIVENPTPEGAQPLTWQVHPEPVLDLATTGEGPEHDFYRVNSGFRMDDGRIVVANQGSSEVRVYSQEGEFLQALGGRGEGPGEFRGLSRVSRYRGDSIFAYDYGLGRWSVFSAHGGFARTARVTTPEGFRVEDAIPFSQGAILGVRVMPPSDRIGREFVGMRQEETTLMTFSPAGEFLNRIATVPGPELYYLERPADQTYYTYRPPLFGFSPAWAISGDMVLASTDRGFELAAFSDSGNLEQLIRIPGPERPVSRGQVNEAFERMTAKARDRPPGLTYDLPYPKSCPPFSHLVVDSEGNLWVSEYAQYFEDPTEWTVFDAQGRLLGNVVVPSRLQIFDIGSDFVLGRHLDDLNVEHVQLFRLSKE